MNNNRKPTCTACFMISNGVKSRKGLIHTCGLPDGAIPDDDRVTEMKERGNDAIKSMMQSAMASIKLKSMSNAEIGQLLYDHILGDCMSFTPQYDLIEEAINRLTPDIFKDEENG